jgi:hypothetical protein
MKKLIISSILIFVISGCSLNWGEQARKCHGSDYDAGDGLRGKGYSGYRSWKCEVRKDPTDLVHIKRMKGWYQVGLSGYKEYETQQRTCRIFKSKGLQCWDYCIFSAFSLQNKMYIV